MYDVGSLSTRGNEKSLAWIIAWMLYACSIGLNLYIKDFDAIGNPLVKLLFQILYIEALGYILIVMITGYRGYVNKYTVSQRCLAILPLWLYSFGTGIVTKGWCSSPNWYNSFFPLINEIFGTITPYVLVAIWGEYINLFAKKIDKSSFKKLLLTMFVLWTIWPTFLGGDMYGQRMGATVFAYLLGAYIAKYEDDFSNRRRTFMIIGVALCAVLVMGTATLNMVSNYVTINIFALVNMTSPIVYMLAFLLVCTISDKSIPRVVAVFGMTCMGAFWIYGNTMLHTSAKRLAVLFIVAHCIEGCRLQICYVAKRIFLKKQGVW